MRNALLCLALVLASVGASARADEADERARTAAREHYAKANSFFDLGRYDEAIVEYEAAYQAKNDAALLYNIAQAHRLASHPAPALRFYKMYLTRRPDAPNRDEVEVKIAALEQLVDAQRKSQTMPPDQPLQTGAKPAAAAVTATPAPATPVDQVAAPAPDRNAGRTKKIAGLAVAGAGVALAVGGIVCAALAKGAADSISSADQMHAPYDPGKYSTLQTDQALAGVLLGVGGAAIVGGVVVYVLGRREATRAARAQIAPSLSPRFAGVSLSVRY
jgi:tetratricopeptide (TPR) repeat protein